MEDLVEALRCLPSYKTFKEVLSDADRRRVYMRAYRSHMSGRVPDQKKSLDRLRQYAEIAGWSNEELKTMQSAAMTPVH